MTLIRKCYADWPYGQIHFRMAGEGDAVLLLGGAPRSGKPFEPVIEILAGHGLCAIAPDLPGFGQSSALPPGTGMSGFAAFLPCLFDTLGLAKAHIFGLHTGAKLAVEAAAISPERVASVILAGKSHSLIPDRETRNVAVFGVVKERYFAGGADDVDGPNPIRGWAAQQRQFVKSWWDDAIFTAPEPAAAICAVEDKIIDELTARRTVRDLYQANFAFDFAGALSQITVPALILEIIDPAEDAALGRQAETLRRFLPAAETAFLPQTDPAGLQFYAGILPLCRVIEAFVGRFPIP